MSVRKTLIAVAAASMMALTLPASADEGLGVGVQTDVYGQVVLASATAVTGDGRHVGTLELAARCAYQGFTTLSGQIQYTVTGEATGYSTVPTSAQTVGTRVTCTLISPQQPFAGSPPTLTWELDARLSGNVALAAADPNTPPTTPAWPPRPVLICGYAEAEFGPDPQSATYGPTCSDTAISP
jgi:hypothetical protein